MKQEIKMFLSEKIKMETFGRNGVCERRAGMTALSADFQILSINSKKAFLQEIIYLPHTSDLY